MDVMAEFLARKQKRDPTLYTDITVAASPAHAWSDITFDDFSCYVRFRYDGKNGQEHLNEEEVCEFLNQTWEAR